MPCVLLCVVKNGLTSPLDLHFGVGLVGSIGTIVRAIGVVVGTMVGTDYKDDSALGMEVCMIVG